MTRNFFFFFIIVTTNKFNRRLLDRYTLDLHMHEHNKKVPCCGVTKVYMTFVNSIQNISMFWVSPGIHDLWTGKQLLYAKLYL